MTNLRDISIAREYVIQELVRNLRQNPKLTSSEVKEQVVKLLDEMTYLTKQERDRCQQEILIMLDINYGKA